MSLYGYVASVTTATEQLYDTVEPRYRNSGASEHPWLRESMDRRAAEAFITQPGNPPGTFVVRRTRKNPGCRYLACG
jgi:hypothetical protein